MNITLEVCLAVSHLDKHAYIAYGQTLFNIKRLIHSNHISSCTSNIQSEPDTILIQSPVSWQEGNGRRIWIKPNHTVYKPNDIESEQWYIQNAKMVHTNSLPSNESVSYLEDIFQDAEVFESDNDDQLDTEGTMRPYIELERIVVSGMWLNSIRLYRAQRIDSYDALNRIIQKYHWPKRVSNKSRSMICIPYNIPDNVLNRIRNDLDLKLNKTPNGIQIISDSIPDIAVESFMEVLDALDRIIHETV